MSDGIEMTAYETKVHTVYVLIGPSGCGKSTFSKDVLIPQLRMNDSLYSDKPISEGKYLNVQYLSSDEIRQDLLGKKYNKHEDEMMYASELAFKLLYQKLEGVTSYPINAEFVIVDTTGLSKKFRDKIISISKNNNYNVEAIIFDYKNKDEYLDHLDESYEKRVVFNHIKRLRQETFKELNRKDYSKIHKIKSKESFNNILFKAKNIGEYVSHYLDEEFEYIIVGDIHGCFSEFQNLLIKKKFDIIDGMLVDTIENAKRKILLLGDYVDKGSQVKEIVEFIYDNKKWFDILYANHENFIYKWLKGKIKKDSVPKEVVDAWFDSVQVFEDNEILKNKFYELVEGSKHFYKHKNFIVTHAPCKRKYLGKLDRYSLKKQMNIRTLRRGECSSDEDYLNKIEESFSFLKEEAVVNHPYHIFGHFAMKDVLRLKNKLGIDTACYNGGRLTSVTIVNRYQKFFDSVPSLQSTKEKTINIFERKLINESAIYNLTGREKSRIENSIKNKVNFISGTMCPADKDEENNNLESLEKALSYYKSKGVKEVILQTKYMGSYCDVYLFKNTDKCYATSRQGYLVRTEEDLGDAVYKPLLEKHLDEMNRDNIKLMILGGELMPWYALGRGLIENQFNVVKSGLETELSFLKENKFENQFAKLEESIEKTGFKKDLDIMRKQDVVEKYTHPVYSTFKYFGEFIKNNITIEEQNKLLKVYKEQLEMYGAEGSLHYKPFTKHKYVYEDGSEKTFFDYKTEDVYSSVSDDDYLVIDLTGDILNEPLLKAHFFFNHQIINQKKEGIVVKPNDRVFIPGVAPFIKVRNEEYLTIIYGYDYKSKNKYKKLMAQKRITRKLRSSIQEFELGKKLLEIPYADINEDNKDYERILTSMIAEEKFEKELDPRL